MNTPDKQGLAYGISGGTDPTQARDAFYRHALDVLREAQVPFLVGGAYALGHYTGIVRCTKDLDIFVKRADCERALEVLSAAGYQCELTFPHWLGKAHCGEDVIDVIFGSGNGLCPVDDEWFGEAARHDILERNVLVTPPEEMIWSKAFILERERYDGADVAHVIRACARTLNWDRLLRRFGEHWRVLFSHLVLFGFIYPAERDRIPSWVVEDLGRRLQDEVSRQPTDERVCRGTLLSRQQYLDDIHRWGYEDARLAPKGNMTPEDVAQWTEAI
jgi:hypothetical protein